MSGDSKRVLLVEDQFLVRSMMAEALADAGFDVVEAESGDEAILLLAGPGSLELVATDIQMPGSADGNAVADEAKRLRPGLPIIYMTGNAGSVSGFVAKRDALMFKPFSPGELLTVVARLLDPPP